MNTRLAACIISFGISSVCSAAANDLVDRMNQIASRSSCTVDEDCMALTFGSYGCRLGSEAIGFSRMLSEADIAAMLDAARQYERLVRAEQRDAQCEPQTGYAAQCLDQQCRAKPIEQK